MSEFYNITFTANNIVCLGITAVLLFLIPVVFWLVWHKRHKGQLKFKYLLAGALGFIVSARVLELGVHVFCIVLDNPVSRFINGNTAAYVLYGIIMAGVFEECGRYVILKYIVKKDRTRENAILYGIGHGGIEVWAVILPSIVMELAIAVMFSSGDIPAALSALNITEETASAALPSVLAASQFGAGMLALNTAERILTMCVHIGLTVIVFYGVSKSRKGFLTLAILLHMIVDIFAALYQRAVVPMWLCEVWIAVWTAVIVFIAVKLYRKMKTQPVSGSVS
jgi:uncharacterized membrane protein YhfC